MCIRDRSTWEKDNGVNTEDDQNMEDDDESDIPQPILHQNKFQRQNKTDRFKNTSGQDADQDSDYSNSRSDLRMSQSLKRKRSSESDEKSKKNTRSQSQQNSGQARSFDQQNPCLLYTSPSPRDRQKSRMPSSA
eukprot:TRINITY_DN22167_c0_g1_i1.p3 TRINITY_DN22167_c0_g1~~TRINITY_DN22167_c0_g1_i1.p3  ORF type:complete len:134 (+),score=18.70 TRINITY_DN22167_c0_g1_i1:61-462(+)